MDQALTKVSTSIAITAALRDQVDRAAAELDRSRSWIAAQAIREWLARHAQQEGEA